jgi:hypothetical protein
VELGHNSAHAVLIFQAYLTALSTDLNYIYPTVVLLMKISAKMCKKLAVK